jgi:hypothetical protein
MLMTFTLDLRCREGDWPVSQSCDAIAAFAGLTVTAAQDAAVTAGWWVDVPWLGPASRRDRCPSHTGRPGRLTGAPWFGKDEYAA